MNLLIIDVSFWIIVQITNPYESSISLSSVQFSHSVVSNSLRSHESQHARPPCPSPTPEVYPNSCPSSWWCHPAVSSSVFPFSSCPQSLPASESFPMSQLFIWGGQSTGVSASASVLPMNTQDWSPLEWTSWISLQSKGLSRVFSNTAVQKVPRNKYFTFVTRYIPFSCTVSSRKILCWSYFSLFKQYHVHYSTFYNS